MTERSGWKRFWERGGWWRAVLVVAVYYVLYLGGGWVLSHFTRDWVVKGATASTTASVFWGVAAPILIGIIVLFAFGASLGWLRQLFGPQPIRGSGWMWIAPIAVLGFNLLRFAGTDYSVYTLGYVLTVLFMGLCVGVAEEMLCRGYAVTLLRKGGLGEWAVMMISSALFAALHAGNVFSGRDLGPVLLQVGYTFCFGVLMYLTLRVTGRLIWPILLHATTDPSGLLLNGGLDETSATNETTNVLGTIGGLGNIVVIILGIILLWFVRGRVTPSPAHEPAHAA